MFVAPIAAQIQWNYLAIPDPFERAYFTGRVAVGGVQDPVTMLHVHSARPVVSNGFAPAHLRLQTESFNEYTPTAFGSSQIQFFSARYNGPGNATNQWCAGLIASIANGGGKMVFNNPDWLSTGQFINTDPFNPNEVLDTRGGLAFYSSAQLSPSFLPSESMQSEVMRIVNRKIGIGIRTDNIHKVDNSRWLGFDEPQARLHVVDHIAVGVAGGESNPALQGRITLFPGSDGIWYHIRNTDSYLDILDGGAFEPIHSSTGPPLGRGIVNPPAPNSGSEIARFLGWCKSMTIGSGKTPIGSTLLITSKPFNIGSISTPNWGIQDISLRIQRIGTDTAGLPENLKNDRNYKLISAGHESEETFIVYGSGKTKIGNEVITTGVHNNWKLSVDGKINCKEVVVTLENWADDVFLPSYNLRALSETEEYINMNGHLPDVPTENQVAMDGIAVGEMQKILLRKVEELTLHLIAIDKENAALKQQLQIIHQQLNER
ncbi:hypothetical protein MASR2M18_14610 [Ignavibacteria bacterium]